jgi:hypothetical protein
LFKWWWNLSIFGQGIQKPWIHWIHPQHSLISRAQDDTVRRSLESAVGARDPTIGLYYYHRRIQLKIRVQISWKIVGLLLGLNGMMRWSWFIKWMMAMIEVKKKKKKKWIKQIHPRNISPR